jgi:hypothetical protein
MSFDMSEACATQTQRIATVEKCIVELGIVRYSIKVRATGPGWTYRGTGETS